MLIKKIGSLLLALTLIIACIPGTMVTAADAAWFDIEVESGTLGSAGGHSADATTGRGYIVAYQSVHAGNNATNTFTRESEGKYDVWAVVGTAKGSDGANRGGYTFTLDTNDEIGSVYMDDAYDVSASDALYSVPNIAEVSVEMRWVKIASNKTIAPGEHSLLSAITRSKNHENNKMGVIDVVRFVPSSWNWTPASNFDAPTYKEWVDLEIQEAALSEGDFGNRHSTIDQVKHLFVAKKDTDGATADWSFEVPVTNSYDVWVLCDDYSGNYESVRYLKINQDDQITIPSSGVAQFTTNVASGWSMGYPNYTFNMHWIKVTTKELTAGQVNTMRWSCDVRTSANDINLTAVRCVRLIPSEWVWKPAQNTMGEYDVALTTAKDMRIAPDENGIIHLEAENGVFNEYMKTETNAAASNGTYAVIRGTGTPGKGGSSTLGFKLEEAGTYDVWAVVGTHQSTAGHLGGLRFKMDGTTIYEKGNGSVDRSNPGFYTTTSLYDGSLADFIATARWVKIASGQALGKGGYTIEAATLNTTLDSYHTTGLIDCVALVPAGVEFDTTSIVPSYTIPDYYDLEAEAGMLTYNLTTANGSNTYVYTENNNGGAANASEMTFVSNGGKYDIWAIVGIDNYPTGKTPRLCYYEFSLDGSQIVKLANLPTLVDGYNPFYATTMRGVPIGAHWVKIAEGLEIAEGSRVIKGAITASGVGNTAGFIDKVRIVPSSWNHVPTDIATAPVAPEVLYGSFTLSDKAAGATATATVTGIKKTVDAEKNAVVIVAVYKNDTLVEVVPSAITALTTEAQTISAPVTLPADITGVTVKAFLWDGLSAAMPYADDIEK